MVMSSIDAAKAAGVSFAMVISVPSVSEPDSIFGKQFGAIEAHLKASGLSYCILQLPMFMQNQWGNLGSISKAGKIYGPAIADAPIALISTDDVAVAAAAILSSPARHANKTYVLTAPAATTHSKIADAFATSLFRDIQYIQVSWLVGWRGGGGGRLGQ